MTTHISFQVHRSIDFFKRIYRQLNTLLKKVAFNLWPIGSHFAIDPVGKTISFSEKGKKIPGSGWFTYAIDASIISFFSSQLLWISANFFFVWFCGSKFYRWYICNFPCANHQTLSIKIWKKKCSISHYLFIYLP